eukprot:Rmarinus@m.22844
MNLFRRKKEPQVTAKSISAVAESCSPPQPHPDEPEELGDDGGNLFAGLSVKEEPDENPQDGGGSAFGFINKPPSLNGDAETPNAGPESEHTPTRSSSFAFINHPPSAVTDAINEEHAVMGLASPASESASTSSAFSFMNQAGGNGPAAVGTVPAAHFEQPTLSVTPELPTSSAPGTPTQSAFGFISGGSVGSSGSSARVLSAVPARKGQVKKKKKRQSVRPGYARDDTDDQTQDRPLNEKEDDLGVASSAASVVSEPDSPKGTSLPGTRTPPPLHASNAGTMSPTPEDQSGGWDHNTAAPRDSEMNSCASSEAGDSVAVAGNRPISMSVSSFLSSQAHTEHAVTDGDGLDDQAALGPEPVDIPVASVPDPATPDAGETAESTTASPEKDLSHRQEENVASSREVETPDNPATTGEPVGDSGKSSSENAPLFELDREKEKGIDAPNDACVSESQNTLLSARASSEVTLEEAKEALARFVKSCDPSQTRSVDSAQDSIVQVTQLAVCALHGRSERVCKEEREAARRIRTLNQSCASGKRRILAAKEKQETAFLSENYDDADKLESEIEALTSELKDFERKLEAETRAFEDIVLMKEELAKAEIHRREACVHTLKMLAATVQDAADKARAAEALEQKTLKDHIEGDEERLAGEEETLQVEEKLLGDEESALETQIRQKTKPQREDREKLRTREVMLEKDILELESKLAAKRAERDELAREASAIEGKIEHVKRKFQRQLDRLSAKRHAVEEQRGTIHRERNDLKRARANLEDLREKGAHAASADEERIRALHAVRRQERHGLRKVKVSTRRQRLVAEKNRVRMAEEATEAETVMNLREEIGKTNAEIQTTASKLLQMQRDASQLRLSLAGIESRVPELEAEKKLAVSARNFKEASRIANELKSINSKKEEVTVKLESVSKDVKANEECLEVLNKRDAELMEQLKVNEHKKDMLTFVRLRYTHRELGRQLEAAIGREEYDEAAAIQTELDDVAAEIDTIRSQHGLTEDSLPALSDSEGACGGDSDSSLSGDDDVDPTSPTTSSLDEGSVSVTAAVVTTPSDGAEGDKDSVDKAPEEANSAAEEVSVCAAPVDDTCARREGESEHNYEARLRGELSELETTMSDLDTQIQKLAADEDYEGAGARQLELDSLHAKADAIRAALDSIAPAADDVDENCGVDNNETSRDDGSECAGESESRGENIHAPGSPGGESDRSGSNAGLDDDTGDNAEKVVDDDEAGGGDESEPEGDDEKKPALQC